MRTLATTIRRVIYSVALLSVIPVYAAETVPDALKDVQLHAIRCSRGGLKITIHQRFTFAG